MTLTPQAVYEKYRLDPNHDMHEYSPFLRQNARGNILEIGVRGGVSTAAFLLGLEKNGGHLWSVDKTEKCGELFKHPQWTFICADSENASNILHVIIPHDKLLLLPSDPIPFDIVLLDGAHYREGIRADLQNYGPLVKSGGLLLVHDIYGEKNPTPEQIAEDWPTEAVGEEFYAFTKEMGWTTLELPGKFGMGVAIRPVIEWHYSQGGPDVAI